MELLAPLCPEKEPKDKHAAEDDIAEVIRKAMAEAEIEVAREDAEGGDDNDPTKKFEANTMFGFQQDEEAAPAAKPARTDTEEIICVPEGEGTRI